VSVVSTRDHFESISLKTGKIPWWWHPWSAETCRRRYCSSVCVCFCACKVGLMSWYREGLRILERNSSLSEQFY